MLSGHFNHQMREFAIAHRDQHLLPVCLKPLSQILQIGKNDRWSSLVPCPEGAGFHARQLNRDGLMGMVFQVCSKSLLQAFNGWGSVLAHGFSLQAKAVQHSEAFCCF